MKKHFKLQKTLEISNREIITPSKIISFLNVFQWGLGNGQRHRSGETDTGQPRDGRIRQNHQVQQRDTGTVSAHGHTQKTTKRCEMHTLKCEMPKTDEMQDRPNNTKHEVP